MLRRILSLICLLALLTACTGGAVTAPTPIAATPTPGGNGSSERVTISFAVSEYKRPSYEPLIEKFMAEHPGIEVVLVSLDEIMSDPANQDGSQINMLRRLVSNADTAAMTSWVTPEVYGSPLLLNLQPLMEADANFQRDDFFPGTLEAYTVRDGTWILPRFFYQQSMSYNADLLQEANLQAPQSGSSWAQIQALAEQLTINSGLSVDRYGMLDYSTGMMPLISILSEQGIDLRALPLMETDVSEQRFVDAINQVRDLFKRGVLYAPFGSDSNQPPPDPVQLIREGRIAMWPSMSLNYGSDGQEVDPPAFTIGNTTFPTIRNFQTETYGEGLFISGGTAFPNESWTWIEWLSRQNIQPPQVGPAPAPVAGSFDGRVPARISLADQLPTWTGMDESTRNALLASLTLMQAPTRSTDYTMVALFSNAMYSLLSDPQADPARVLADSQKQRIDQMAQITPTPEPNLNPVIVATPQPQKAPDGAATIRFGVFGAGPMDVRRIARAFNNQNERYFVEVKSTDNFTQAVTIADMTTISDCFLWINTPIGPGDDASLLDIRPLIEADANFPADEYAPGVLSAFQRDGKQFGLPYAYNLRTLNYNRTLFDQAGQTAPTADWTPEEFLRVAQGLTQGSGDAKIYGYASMNAFTDLLFFANQFGAPLISGSGSDLRVNFDDPKVIDAIKWYVDLSKVHQVMPPLAIYYKRSGQDDVDLSYEFIQNNRVAMWFDYGYGSFNPEYFPPDQPKLDFGLAPMPIGLAGLTPGDLLARGLFIGANTQQPEGCWEFLKFLSTDTTLMYREIPARDSVAASDRFLATAPEDLKQMIEIYGDTLRRPSGNASFTSEAMFYGSGVDLYWLSKAIMEYSKGEAELEAGLQDAQKFTTAYLACVNEGKPTWECATQADPQYDGYNTPPDEQPIPSPRG